MSASSTTQGGKSPYCWVCSSTWLDQTIDSKYGVTFNPQGTLQISPTGLLGRRAEFYLKPSADWTHWGCVLHYCQQRNTKCWNVFLFLRYLRPIAKCWLSSSSLQQWNAAPSGLRRGGLAWGQTPSDHTHCLRRSWDRTEDGHRTHYQKHWNVS